MYQYKKRLRLFAERLGFEIVYPHGRGLGVRDGESSIAFSPASKSDMTCTVTTITGSFTFSTQKDYVFDIIQQHSYGRSLVTYAQRYAPLTLEQYVNEERAASNVSDLRERIKLGSAQNGELGGNHYQAEYYNGILILFDLFTDAPTNVIDLIES